MLFMCKKYIPLIEVVALYTIQNYFSFAKDLELQFISSNSNFINFKLINILEKQQPSIQYVTHNILIYEI